LSDSYRAGASVALLHSKSGRRVIAMSQQMVGIVVERLLSDRDLRLRFALDQIETLAALHLRGFELTPDEMDMFVRTDVRVWFCGSGAAADRVH
jgi:hypothetical protein